jgi:hypothetical protein
MPDLIDHVKRPKLFLTVVRDCWPPNAVPIENSQLSASAYELRVPLTGECRKFCGGADLISFVPRVKAIQDFDMFADRGALSLR